MIRVPNSFLKKNPGLQQIIGVTITRLLKEDIMWWVHCKHVPKGNHTYKQK